MARRVHSSTSSIREESSLLRVFLGRSSPRFVIIFRGLRNRVGAQRNARSGEEIDAERFFGYLARVIHVESADRRASGRRRGLSGVN